MNKKKQHEDHFENHIGPEITRKIVGSKWLIDYDE